MIFSFSDGWPGAVLARSVWDALDPRSVCAQSAEKTRRGDPASAWPTLRGQLEQLEGRQSVGLAGARAVL